MGHHLILQSPEILGRGGLQARKLAILLVLLMIGRRSSLGSQLLSMDSAQVIPTHTGKVRSPRENLLQNVILLGSGCQMQFIPVQQI